METIQIETIKIFKCIVSFKHTQYYIEVILIATNKNEAKKKLISKCLEKYDEIVTIDFTQFYNKDEDEDKDEDKDEYEKLPLDFHKYNITEFEKYLNNKIDSDIDNYIECLDVCSFEIINKYD